MTRSHLTRRQVEVLDLLSRGLTFVQVGNRLGLSHYTIRSHMRYVLRRLHALNTAHAVRIALERGLLPPDGPPRDDHRTGDAGP